MPVIECEDDEPCVVDCDDPGDCAGGIDCSGASSCDITCTGDGSCAGPIECGDGPCAIDCTGSNSCGGSIDCDDACACDWSILLAPGNPDLMFVGVCPSRLFRSEDGGRTWTEPFARIMQGCPRILHTRVTSLCGHPGDPPGSRG